MILTPINQNLQEDVIMWLLCQIYKEDLKRHDYIGQVKDFSSNIYNWIKGRQVAQRGVTAMLIILKFKTLTNTNVSNRKLKEPKQYISKP